jgi:SAM-dependent methyltransferase
MDSVEDAMTATQPGFEAGHFYSPNVDPSEAAAQRDRLWPARPERPGLDFRSAAQTRFLRGAFARWAPGFPSFLEGQPDDEPFREPNGYFEGLDSRVLYALLRDQRPSRVVEIGSGWSSRLVVSAIREFLGTRTSLTTIDPYGSDAVAGLVSGHGRFVAAPVQDLDTREFEALGRDDILFVDSSHVVKTGSDSQFLLTEVLPRLRPGVLVHFHDIFLPFEYPEAWVIEQRRDWNEQYTLQALLTAPTRYEIDFASSFAGWRLRDEITSVLGPDAPGGTSMWFRVMGRRSTRRRQRGRSADPSSDDATPAGEAPEPAVTGAAALATPDAPAVAYHPDLVPPVSLMRTEGIDVLEDWFRWAEEWSMLLRVYGRLGRRSRVLEIGCGLGRTAFALRFLVPDGTYDGFDITREKIEFLQGFSAQFSNFRFHHADLVNTYYNPKGTIAPHEFTFPFGDGTFDVVYAASVFTHLLPVHAEHYLQESARVLDRGGRVLVSAFLLDQYRPGRPRALGFTRDAFAFDDGYAGEAGFAVGNPANVEEMTAYSLERLNVMAARADLRIQHIVPGIWSGTEEHSIGAQDLIVFERA